MTEEMKTCPNCESPYGYALKQSIYKCPECDFEWDSIEQEQKDSTAALDANGNILVDGDHITIIKDLPVKGAPKPIKAGTKVKNIRIVEGDHNINCKIVGFGPMALKSEFVKKA